MLLTSRYAVKPAEKVVEEVRAIKRIWGRPFIEFADDNSFANKRASKRLLRALAPENIRWFAEVDLSVAEDTELLELMRDSGCRQVLIGLESPSETSLDGVELKANWKMRQVANHPEAVAKIQSHGIKVIGCFVLGLDGDTPGIFQDVHDYALALELSDVQVTFMTPFPGTPLYKRLRSEGRLIRDGAWELCTLFDINYKPRNLSVDELQEGFLWLVKNVYSEEETAARNRRFKETMRSSPNARRRATSA